MDDPFLGEWEHIHAYVRASPMASGGDILREWQRRFPGRFVGALLNLLQRRLREIRAHLLGSQEALSVGEVGGATASRALSELTEAVAPLADVLAVVFPDPVSPSSSLPPPLTSRGRAATNSESTVFHIRYAVEQGRR
jgi:hypothetical protein